MIRRLFAAGFFISDSFNADYVDKRAKQEAHLDIPEMYEYTYSTYEYFAAAGKDITHLPYERLTDSDGTVIY